MPIPNCIATRNLPSLLHKLIPLPNIKGYIVAPNQPHSIRCLSNRLSDLPYGLVLFLVCGHYGVFEVGDLAEELSDVFGCEFE